MLILYNIWENKMNLSNAQEGLEYIIKDIATDDEELDAFYAVYDKVKANMLRLLEKQGVKQKSAKTLIDQQKSKKYLCGAIAQRNI